MKVRESLAATTMVLSGLAAGCSVGPSELADPRPGTVTAETIGSDIQQAYAEALQFWTGQGVAINPALVLPRNQTVVCSTETITPDKGKKVTAAACLATNTLIIWPEALVEPISKAQQQGAIANYVATVVTSHEIGHFVQEDHNIMGHKDSEPIIEPQADCLAGATMRGTHPNAETSVKIYYDGIEKYLGRRDTQHGGSEHRFASFMLGYAPQPGKNCDDVAPLGPTE